MNDHGLILMTYWMSAASLLILLEVHVAWPLMRAGARHRERVLESIRSAGPPDKD